MRAGPYNSAELQKKFPEVYRELFASSELVVSCPVSFQWAGNCAKRFGSLAVMQSLPLRVYVACERVAKTRTVSFGHHWLWLPDQQKFHRTEMSHKESSEAHLSFLTSLPWCRDSGWLIHLLDEAPGNHGLAKTGSRACALAVGIGILGGEWTCEEFSRALKSKPEERHKPTGLVDRWVRRATKLYSLASGYMAVPSGIPATAIHSGLLPVMSWSTYQPEILESRFNEIGDTADLDRLDQVQWQSYALDEFFGPIRKTHNWPIDILLLSTGHDSAGGTNMFLLQKQKFLKSLLDEKYPRRMHDVGPLASLVASTLPFSVHDPWQLYIAIMGLLSLRLTKDLYDTISSHTDTAIKFLAKSMNHYQEALGLVSLATPYHTPKIIRIQELLREAVWKTTPNVISGMKLAGTSIGGDLLVVTPMFSLREILPTIIERLQQEVSPAIDLDYASWVDGFEKDGLRIEHAPKMGIHHPFVPQGRQPITLVGSDDSLRRVFVTKLDPDMADIVMDEVNEKLWVGGKKVTVAEIPSQRMAIVLLKALIKSDKWRVANTDLPESSYSEYRNDLQSKVIGKLKRLCEKRLGKELILGIKGTLTKFDIVWSPDDITLAIREKVS